MSAEMRTKGMCVCEDRTRSQIPSGTNWLLVFIKAKFNHLGHTCSLCMCSCPWYRVVRGVHTVTVMAYLITKSYEMKDNLQRVHIHQVLHLLLLVQLWHMCTPNSFRLEWITSRNVVFGLSSAAAWFRILKHHGGAVSCHS